jgi:hypothetical protein
MGDVTWADKVSRARENAMIGRASRLKGKTCANTTCTSWRRFRAAAGAMAESQAFSALDSQLDYDVSSHLHHSCRHPIAHRPWLLLADQ